MTNIEGDGLVEAMEEIPQDLRQDLLDMDVNINNISSTFNIGPGVVLDLSAIATRGINMVYNGGSKITYQIRDPPTTANIFASGKVFMMGSQEEEEARRSSRKVARTIQKMIAWYPREVCKTKKIPPENIKVVNFKVVNMFATTQLPWDIKLLSLASSNKECFYEPELSLNINYQIKDPKASVTITSNGKLIIKAPSLANIHSAIRRVYIMAWPCRKVRRVKMDEEEPVKINHDKRWRSK